MSGRRHREWRKTDADQSLQGSGEKKKQSCDQLEIDCVRENKYRHDPG